MRDVWTNLSAFAVKCCLLINGTATVRGKESYAGKLGGRMRILTLVATLTALLLSTSAFATFPGQNGKIVFQLGTYPDVSRIATINPDGSGETILTQGPHDYVPKWSPDGSKITWQGDQIYVMNADGSDPTQLSFSGCCNRWPSFSPDGAQIFYLNPARKAPRKSS